MLSFNNMWYLYRIYTNIISDLQSWGQGLFLFNIQFSEQNILSTNNIIKSWLSDIQAMGTTWRENSSKLRLAGSLIKGAEG